MKKIVLIVAAAMAAEATAAGLPTYKTLACVDKVVYGGSGGKFTAPNEGGPIQIIGARYGGTGSGPNNPTNSIEVTDRVASWCDGKHRCRFDINNSTMGGDPVPRRNKWAAVHFACFDRNNPTSRTKYEAQTRVFSRVDCKASEHSVRVDKEGSYMEIWCEGH